MSTTPAPVVRALTQARIQAYADASGDQNPIHVDEEFARTTPFGGTIAHGMLVLGLIGEMMFGALGERWLATGRLKVRFKAPTRPGDTVTASAAVTKESAGMSEYDVRCVNQRGEAIIEGRATVGTA